MADTLKAWEDVGSVVGRRVAVQRVQYANGDKGRLNSMGLASDDPEYGLLTFAAGRPFNPSNRELEVIVTVGLLSQLFADAEGLADGGKQYSDFVGRKVTIEVPQFASTGQELTPRARQVKLAIAGVILYGEGGRQIYLPNTTERVFDRYKMDRTGTVELPVNSAGDGWSDLKKVDELAAFPWRTILQVYSKQISDVVPLFQRLAKQGYSPQTEIWKYKWVLDVRDLAGRIFGPLLVLIAVAVGLTVATNLFTARSCAKRNSLCGEFLE